MGRTLEEGRARMRLLVAQCVSGRIRRRRCKECGAAKTRLGFYRDKDAICAACQHKRRIAAHRERFRNRRAV